MTRATLAPSCAMSGRAFPVTDAARSTIRARGTADCPSCGRAVVSRFSAERVYLSPHRIPASSPRIP